MVSALNLPYLWVTLFLVICSVLDFHKAKIPNEFIIFAMSVSITFLLFFHQQFYLLNIFLSFLITFVVGFFLFKFKILGGGDIKALVVVSIFLNPMNLQDFFFYSLLWAGVYSIIFFSMSGQIFKLLFNTFGVYKKFSLAAYKIPFTFGILLGWLSLFTVGVLSW